MSVGIVALVALGKPVFEIVEGKLALLVMSGVTVGVTTGIASWLRVLAQSGQAGEEVAYVD